MAKWRPSRESKEGRWRHHCGNKALGPAKLKELNICSQNLKAVGGKNKAIVIRLVCHETG